MHCILAAMRGVVLHKPGILANRTYKRLTKPWYILFLIVEIKYGRFLRNQVGVLVVKDACSPAPYASSRRLTTASQSQGCAAVAAAVGTLSPTSCVQLYSSFCTDSTSNPCIACRLHGVKQRV